MKFTGKPSGTSSDRGAVMLEYVVLCGLVGTALATLGRAIFDPASGYGVAGLQLAHYIQRILAGIALPIP